MKLDLKPESWKNIFVTLTQNDIKTPISNFWASIQHLQDQFFINQEKILTIKKLKTFGDNETIASGIIYDERLNNFLIKWVAVSGNGYFDWTIYRHYSEKSIDYIKCNGDKIFSKDVIRELVPCDDEAFKMYKF